MQHTWKKRRLKNWLAEILRLKNKITKVNVLERLLLRWVKSFAIFWVHEGQSCSSWCFLSRSWRSLDCEIPNSLDTCWMCLYGLEIHSFWLSWLCLVIEVLVTLAKCLEPSGYCIVINCCFWFFLWQYGPVQLKSLGLQFRLSHIHFCCFQIAY